MLRNAFDRSGHYPTSTKERERRVLKKELPVRCTGSSPPHFFWRRKSSRSPRQSQSRHTRCASNWTLVALFGPVERGSKCCDFFRSRLDFNPASQIEHDVRSFPNQRTLRFCDAFFSVHPHVGGVSVRTHRLTSGSQRSYTTKLCWRDVLQSEHFVLGGGSSSYRVALIFDLRCLGAQICRWSISERTRFDAAKATTRRDFDR